MVKYWLWLTTRRNVGPVTIRKLLRTFASPEEVYSADPELLQSVEGLTRAEREGLSDHSMDAVDRILADCYEKNIRILTMQDAQYPHRLRNISTPPAVLYYQGRLPDFDAEPVIAVVGTRKATSYGTQLAYRLGCQLARCGGLVVSGLAAGVDSWAMRGALQADSPVIGVAGCGLDITYPRSSTELYRDVMFRGCLLSEYPPGTPPRAGNFPVRNRIISGLSLGIVVVEAGERSGALITAEQALDQGRDVFAVPGNVGSEQSRGCNRLLQQGAILVSTGWDVLQEYQAMFPRKLHNVPGADRLTAGPAAEAAGSTAAEKPETAASAGQESADTAAPAADTAAEVQALPVGWDAAALERLRNSRSRDQIRVVETLLEGPLQADDIVERTGLSAACVNAVLSLLEVEGIAERLSGRRFRLLPPDCI